MQEIVGFIKSMQVQDVLDILLVTAIIYFILSVIRESRSPTAMRGLLGMMLAAVAVYTLARLLDLTTTTMLFERFWLVLVLLFIIVFQNEFRKALTDLGHMWVFRRLFMRNTAAVDEIVKAVRTFSRQKVGALICLERRTPLKVYAETGTAIDGLVSAELLRTIFMTYSPLHDGAVIVRGDRIVAAGCILPLSANPALAKELGTRHRAAIGLSEETDAAVVVVSEETGIVSLALRGKIERNHTQESLREAIKDILDVKDDEEEEPAAG